MKLKRGKSPDIHDLLVLPTESMYFESENIVAVQIDSTAPKARTIADRGSKGA